MSNVKPGPWPGTKYEGSQVALREGKMEQSRTCAWCGEPATDTRIIERAVVRLGELIRPEKTVACCATHAGVVDRNNRERELRARIKRLVGRLDNPRYRHEDVQRELAHAHAQLAALS